MAIIALASAVIIPRISNSDGKLYQAQLRTLTAVLNYHRRNAVILNRPQNAKLYPYISESGEGEAIKADKTTTHKTQWQSQGADISWQSGTVKSSNQVIDIQYFPQGGATGGTITLQQGKFVAQLSIDGMTGKTSIKESILEE